MHQVVRGTLYEEARIRVAFSLGYVCHIKVFACSVYVSSYSTTRKSKLMSGTRPKVCSVLYPKLVIFSQVLHIHQQIEIVTPFSNEKNQDDFKVFDKVGI